MDNNSSSPSQTPRRTFLKTASKAVATTTLLSGAAHSLNFRPVHAAGSDSINIALIGCGGRGGGAAADAPAQCVHLPCDGQRMRRCLDGGVDLAVL